MKFTITRADVDWNEKEPPPLKWEGLTFVPPKREWDDPSWVVEITTLEQLMALQKACGHELIIGPHRITIYDYYVE